MNAPVKAVACCLLVVCCGCSFFRRSTQQVSVNCSEPDAILLIDGQRYTVPAKVRLKRNRNFTLQCFKNGYYPYLRNIDCHRNKTGVLDTIGTFCMLFPGIGLLTSGAWSLDETEIFIPLYADK